jgi:chromosome segregation ATPase
MCLLTLVGTLPVFAANSTSINHEQLQTKHPQTSNQNNSTIVTGLKKIHSLFTQNEALKKSVIFWVQEKFHFSFNLQKDVEKIYDDLNKEHTPRNRDPKTEIENSMKNEIKTQYINSVNQINNNSTQIESLTNQNSRLNEKIKNLQEIHETTMQKINSTKSEINNNNSEIESLINQNKELMEKIQNISENS